MMTDVTDSEKTALNTFADRAIADDCHPPSPRIRTLKGVVAKLEPPQTVAAAPLSATGHG
jgi:hypothetical protein